jgi:F-type H+-transporting ATPase subunit delta
MRGASGTSLAAARARFEPVLRAAGERSLALGEELFAVVDALDSSAALRRTLADPSLPSTAKSSVAAQVLSGGFDPEVVELIRSLAGSRWSADRDLTDAVEELALSAVLAAAEARGTLETVEDEIFRITRALQGQREARQVLSNPGVKVAQRVALIEALLVGKADPITVVLARRATAVPRGRRFVRTLLLVGNVIAERRSLLVATVTSAVELSQAQQERLMSLLGQAYGETVELHVTVDPTVLGGLRIQVGSDVVDNTTLSRLADARRQLAG